MNENHIDHVVELYRNRQTVDKEAYLASFEDIKNNDFNLNIPRYVDTSEAEEEIDIRKLTSDMKATDASIKEANSDLLKMLGELTFNSDETRIAIDDFKQLLKEV